MRWQTTTTSLDSGPRGTVDTLRAMEQLALAGSRQADVIRAAQNAARRARERDDRGTVAALLADVRSRMRYTPDPLDVELVKAPSVSIQGSNLYGVEPMDCDDASTLLASYLGAVGIPWEFTVVSADPARPREWSHVYVTAHTKQGNIALDPIVRDFRAGQEVPASRLLRPRGHYSRGALMMGRLGCEGCPRKEMLMRPKNRLNGVGNIFSNQAAQYTAAQQAQNTASPGILDQATGFVTKSAGSVADAYAKIKAMLHPAQAPTAPPPQRVPREPGFFQKRDASGHIVTDPIKVGGALAVAALAAWLITKSSRRK